MSSISSASSSTTARRPRQVERAAFEVIAQTARRADDDMRAMRQAATFLRGIHAADARRDARARLGIEPGEFAADLQRQFARRRDDQRERQAGGRQLPVDHQFVGEGEPERDGLARAGLRGDDEIAADRALLDDLRLDGGERVVATRDEGFRQKRGDRFK